MSALPSPKRNGSTLLANPTFADGPSSFLQQLATKVQSNSSTTGNSSTEIQRVRSQLTSEVQNTHSKQEMRMRQLDGQLSLLQQKIRPQLQSIERQQGFTQSHLDDVRNRVQSLVSDDVSKLQQDFDKLGMKFDRFLRVDLESKLRPMQDDLRTSRAKLDELMSNVTNSFQRVTDNVEELSHGVETAEANLAAQKNKFERRVDELTPKLTKLEDSIKDLQERLDVTQGYNNGFSELQKTLKESTEAVEYLRNDFIPSKIAESSADFVEKMGSITTRCDSELSNIQSDLDGIIASNQQAEVERKDAESNLEQLITTSFDVENQLSTIETETKTKLNFMSHELESNVAQIKARLAEVTHTTEDSDRQQSKLDESVEDLRHSMEGNIRDLRERIRINSAKNLKAQTTTYSLLTDVKNALEGDSNLIGHLNNIESQIDWCVAAIKMIDEERLEAQKKGADPQNIIGRTKNIEERMTNALLRVKRAKEGAKRVKPEKKKEAQEEEEKPEKKPDNEDEEEDKNEEEEDKNEEEEEKPVEKKHRKKKSKKPAPVDEEEEEKPEQPVEKKHRKKKSKKPAPAEEE